MKLATKVVSQEDIDLALLRADIAAPGIASLITGGGPAVLGSAFVIGYPNQGLVTIEPILTPVEVLGREWKTPRGPAIVLRGDISSGNSGGPTTSEERRGGKTGVHRVYMPVETVQ